MPRMSFVRPSRSFRDTWTSSRDDESLGAEWREPVSDMRRQALRMREIVEDLLELSRLESTSDEAPMTPVDVPGLIERLVREARTAADPAPRFDLDIDYACVLRGNDGELHSIASNLISNAIKYTPADGTITIRWGRDTGGAALTVRDTGIGIAPEHLPRLTERFYRVDRARAREKGGSGLGLSIVKHALQRHGGRLEIESEEGRGSTFTARFPARRVLARETGCNKSVIVADHNPGRSCPFRRHGHQPITTRRTAREKALDPWRHGAGCRRAGACPAVQVDGTDPARAGSSQCAGGQAGTGQRPVADRKHRPQGECANERKRRPST